MVTPLILPCILSATGYSDVLCIHSRCRYASDAVFLCTLMSLCYRVALYPSVLHGYTIQLCLVTVFRYGDTYSCSFGRFGGPH